MNVKTLVPLSFSLKNLDLAGIKYEILDKEPHTIAQKEQVAVYFDEKNPVIYHTHGYWDQGCYKISDTLWHPEKEKLEEDYAKEWAILSFFDYDMDGSICTDEHTKWKPNTPQWDDWLRSKGFKP